MKESLIFEKLKIGDESVLAEVYGNYRDEFVFWMVKKYGCDTDVALEIYQNAILLLCENLRSGSLEIITSSIKTYLFALGKNKYFEFKRYKERFDIDDYSIYANYIENTTDESISRYEDNFKKVKKSIVLLGEPCKSILEMFYYTKMTCEEISTRLNYKNEDTVKNQKYKCLLKLKKIFEQQPEDVNNNLIE
jgi:RNA polymerase sigma-70 factor (ECF subfamily)